jgi:hypothetical protein
VTKGRLLLGVTAGAAVLYVEFVRPWHLRWPARVSTESLRVDVLEMIRIYALPAIEQQLAPGPGEG